MPYANFQTPKGALDKGGKIRHPLLCLCCGNKMAGREWELILSSADLDGFGRGHMSTASARGYKYEIKFPFLYTTLPSRKAELPQCFHSSEVPIFAIMTK